MRIGSYGQAGATLQAAAFKYFSTIGCGHALAETVYAHSMADAGLICTFWHSSSLFFPDLITWQSHPAGLYRDEAELYLRG